MQRHLNCTFPHNITSTNKTIFNRSLDYENLVRHTLVITAKDSGVPPLSANLTLVVDVQDVNDNPPVFEHDSYVASVLESEPVNTKVSGENLCGMKGILLYKAPQTNKKSRKQ